MYGYRINGQPIVLSADGTAAAPSQAFANAATRGLFNDLANIGIGFTVGGVQKAFLVGAEFRLAQGVEFSFASSGITSPDVVLLRAAANVLAQRNGNADQAFLVGGANGVATGYKTLSELTTIAAAATTDTAIEIPANAIVLAVSVRVTTAIPTATSFTVIGTTTSTAFQTGTSVAVTVDTTDAGTKSCPYLNTTAQTIRFTPSTSPAANTGRVRVTIHYIEITPATS